MSRMSIPRFTGWRTAVGSKAGWKTTDGGREAKYYSVTKAGRQQLDVETEGWKRLCEGISLVLETVE
jgi:PadR family transcriptional regulator